MVILIPCVYVIILAIITQHMYTDRLNFTLRQIVLIFTSVDSYRMPKLLFYVSCTGVLYYNITMTSEITS